MNTDRTLDNRELKDLKVLARFTAIYCRCHHAGPKRTYAGTDPRLAAWARSRVEVCAACREFLDYAVERRVRCPLDPKPTCKHCPVHCYRAGHREQVRAIMKFSGPYLIRRGRLDLLWHYFF